MVHMPRTGVSGADLYTFDNDAKVWKWVATNSNFLHFPRCTGVLVSNSMLAKTLRQYLLYLPLYNGVTDLKIGVNDGARLEPDRNFQAKPIVWYGTSIAQGACASRPSMAFLNQLSRAISRPVFNFGFSGNGQMEPEVYRFLNEIDAAMFVIDCLPNMNATGVATRTEPLVRTLRTAHAAVPIVLVENQPFGQLIFDDYRAAMAQTNKALFDAFTRLQAAGVPNLHYVKSEQQFSGLPFDVVSPTVDGVHPTDLGFWFQSQFYTKFLPPLLS